jgi:uncharacterized cupin superfamily protein/glyoxylase-like metal-dependent hydrolase (beta-lactamase superfamily II)
MHPQSPGPAVLERSGGGAAKSRAMQQLAVPNAFAWSRHQPERKIDFNSHVFVVPGGNVAVDPLPMKDDEAEAVSALGGLAWIVVTNRDHVRDAASLQERFGAKIATSAAEAPLLGIAVDRELRDGEEIFPGAFAVALEHQKTPGEFALHLRAQQALLVGDALIGAPAGALSLLPDAMYADVAAAVLALRRLWALQPKTLLLGDGASLWSDATAAIGKLLLQRGGIAVNRINLDELRYEASCEKSGKYRSQDAEVGFFIGAQRLGYQVVKLPPGARFCPVHAEYTEEELFFVLDGSPSIRTPSETLPLRAGDFIAFPSGPDHAHQVLNQSEAEATVLLLGENQAQAICYYPESDKVLIADPRKRWLLRGAPQLDYYDGE